MTVVLTVNSIEYQFPENLDTNWGATVTAWAGQVSSSSLQKSAGTFTLTAELDFGASYGVKSLYFKSRATDAAAGGVLRLGNTDTVNFRNAADGADLALGVNTSNELIFNGSAISTGGTLQQAYDNGNGITTTDSDGAFLITGSGIITGKTTLGTLAATTVSATGITATTVSGTTLEAGSDVNTANVTATSSITAADLTTTGDVNAANLIATTNVNGTDFTATGDMNAVNMTASDTVDATNYTGDRITVPSGNYSLSLTLSGQPVNIGGGSGDTLQVNYNAGSGGITTVAGKPFAVTGDAGITISGVPVDIAGHPHPEGYIHGGFITWDNVNDCTITAVKCRDFADEVNASSTVSYTKQFDANYAHGVSAGGWGGGSRSLSKTNYFFMIIKTDGTTDFGWDEDSVATNLLIAANVIDGDGGWTRYRLMCPMLSNAGTNTELVGYIMDPNNFSHMRNKIISGAEISIGSAAQASSSTARAEMPISVTMDASVSFRYVVDTNTYYVNFGATSDTIPVPAFRDNYLLTTNSEFTNVASVLISLDGSADFGYRFSSANALVIRVTPLGFYWNRRGEV